MDISSIRKRAKLVMIVCGLVITIYQQSIESTVDLAIAAASLQACMDAVSTVGVHTAGFL